MGIKKGFGREEAQNVYSTRIIEASLVAQMVKNLPAMQETWVQSLGQEDLLEEGMAAHSSILAWRILWTERSLVGPSPWVAKSQT